MDRKKRKTERERERERERVVGMYNQREACRHRKVVKRWTDDEEVQ